jgi:hypothetical protein
MSGTEARLGEQGAVSVPGRPASWRKWWDVQYGVDPSDPSRLLRLEGPPRDRLWEGYVPSAPELSGHGDQDGSRCSSGIRRRGVYSGRCLLAGLECKSNATERESGEVEDEVRKSPGGKLRAIMVRRRWSGSRGIKACLAFRHDRAFDVRRGAASLNGESLGPERSAACS